MLKGPSLWGTVFAGQKDDVMCLLKCATPPTPISWISSGDSFSLFFLTIKAKMATLSIKQEKQANLKQTSLISFEMFPAVLSYSSI